MDKTEKRDIAERLATADLGEIIRNPRDFGAPTWEEFKANPEKWRRPAHELLARVDSGTKTLRKLKEHWYYFEDHRCTSIEDVERVAREEGVDLSTLPDNCVKIGLEQLAGGQFRAHCKFHRPGWVPGEKGIHETVDGPAQ